MSDTSPLVAVIDDNEVGRYAMARMLEHAGYRVEQGGTGAEALRLAQTQPLAVLLDVHLPDASGFDVCRQIKSDPNLIDIVVIMASATAVEVEHRVYGLEGGADGYLVQPIDPTELLATIKAHLRLRNVTRRARRLQQVTTALSNASDELSAARLVADACCAAVGAAAAAVVFQAPGSNDAELVYQVGYDTADPWRDGEAAEARLVTKVMRSGAPLFTSELAVDAPHPALAIAPLGAYGVVQGAVWIGFNRDHFFTHEEQTFILTLANQLSLAVARTRAQEAQYRAWAIAENAAARATMLADVSQILGGMADGSDGYEAVTGRLLPVLADFCALYLVNSGQTLHLAALSAMDLGDVKLTADVFEAAAGELATWLTALDDNRSGSAWNGPRSRELGIDPPPGLEGLVAQVQPRALIIAPLITRGEIEGALLLGRIAAGRDYAADDIQLAQELAFRVAAAADAANLFAESQSLNRRLEERVRERTAELEAQIQERLIIEKELDRSREELRSFSARLQAVREEEQARLSRELHDELGGALTGLKIDVAQIMRHLPPDSEDLKSDLTRLSNTLDLNVKVVRQIATQLRPSILDDFGLPAALEWQMDEFAARTGLECHMDLRVGERHWDQGQAIALFRIFQEALTNVARHSGADRVEARLEEDGAEIVLTVRDNGHGVSAGQISRSGALGLMGMQERTHAMGGRFELHSQPGEGTTIEVRIPSDGAAPADHDGATP